MEHEPINTFIQTLSEWGTHEKDYQGQDYVSAVCILGFILGDQKIMLINDYDNDQLYENNLKQYLIDLVENKKFNEVFLVASLSNYLLNWLKKGCEMLLDKVWILEELIKEHPESVKTWQPKLDKVKSAKTKVCYKNDYYKWQLLSLSKLGQEQLDKWESDKTQEQLKTINF